MEKTISKLFEIEEKAKLIINRAGEEKIRLHDEYEEKTSVMEKETAADNVKNIQEFRSVIEKDLEDEKNSLLEKSEVTLRELEELYKKNHETLVEKIFDNIINS